MEVDTESLSSDGLEQEDEQGWEDLEDDAELVKIISLFDDRTFQNVKEMLQDCKERYDFDIWKVRRELGQYFLTSLRLTLTQSQNSTFWA